MNTNLNNISSIPTFLDYFINSLENSTSDEFVSLLKDTKISNFLQNKTGLINLLHKSVIVYDFQPNTRMISNKSELVNRSYLFAFIKTNIVEQFSKLLSQKGIIVGVYNHLTGKSYIYQNNKRKKWVNEEIVISYEITCDKLGNPNLLTREHIRDYGSDIYEFIEFFNSKEFTENFLTNYIQISVINVDFNTPISLINTLIEVINQF